MPGNHARLATAFALGAIATVASVLLDIPGRGEFIATSWLAGALAAISCRGARGLASGLAGVVTGGIAVPVLGLPMTIIALPLSIVGGLFFHGWLGASLAIRARRDGLAAAGTPVGIVGLIVFAAAIAGGAWLALQFAANPA